MEDIEYPALYCVADNAAKEAQKILLRCFKINSSFLVLGAIASLFSALNTFFALLSAVLFLTSLSVYIYSKHQRYQNLWYQSRALAESIKTSTWRLIMAAEPYTTPTVDTNIEKFLSLLRELLRENESLGSSFSNDFVKNDQITSHLLESLSLNFQDKKQKYLVERIEEQRNWYAIKSKENRKKSTRYFILICIAYATAIGLLLIRIIFPNAPFLPIQASAVLASSFIGWIQLKRFDELSSAYALTALEVGIIKDRYRDVSNSTELSDFVSDAENAFSREHTQWAARRDH
jgi:hypothetical protein